MGGLRLYPLPSNIMASNNLLYGGTKNMNHTEYNFSLKMGQLKYSEIQLPKTLNLIFYFWLLLI